MFWIGFAVGGFLFLVVGLLVGANNNKLVERERDRVIAEAEEELKKLEGRAKMRFELWLAYIKEKWGRK